MKLPCEHCTTQPGRDGDHECLECEGRGYHEVQADWLTRLGLLAVFCAVAGIVYFALAGRGIL